MLVLFNLAIKSVFRRSAALNSTIQKQTKSAACQEEIVMNKDQLDQQSTIIELKKLNL